MTQLFSVSHPDDLWTMQYVIRMTYDVGLCHPDEITNLILKSSVWLSFSQYLIWMTYGHCRMSSGWLTILPSFGRHNVIWTISHPDELDPDRISSAWLIINALCHPDDLAVGISSGWVTVNSLCHPDDIPFHRMSSGWLNWGWYLIWMSYGSVIMSSGWDTLPVLCHPDEIANFDFPQHVVALQRFRTNTEYPFFTNN